MAADQGDDQSPAAASLEDSSRLDFRGRTLLRRLRQQPTSSGYTPWGLPPELRGVSVTKSQRSYLATAHMLTLLGHCHSSSIGPHLILLMDLQDEDQLQDSRATLPITKARHADHGSQPTPIGVRTA